MVRWVGKSHIAWLESRFEEEGDFGVRTAPAQLIQYDTVSGRRRTLSKRVIVKDACTVGFRSETGRWLRGFPQYEIWSGAERGLFQGPQNQTPPIRPRTNPFSENMQIGEPAESTVSVGKHEFRLPLGTSTVVLTEPSGHRAWIVDGEYAESAGDEESLVEVDGLTGKSQVVIRQLVDIDFLPMSPYYAGLTNRKFTSAYGPKMRVWTRQAIVGDIRTGKRWSVTSGVVQASSVSLQP